METSQREERADAEERPGPLAAPLGVEAVLTVAAAAPWYRRYLRRGEGPGRKHDHRLSM